MSRRPDLSCVIVNYNSGAFAVEAARSLLAQRWPGGDPISTEILVVENASPDDQEPYLRRLEEMGCRVLRSDRNLGYGAGANLGAREAAGRYLLVSNPDVLAAPGASAALLETLAARPEVTVAGPRGFLDPGLFLLLPPLDLPTLARHLSESLGRLFPDEGERAARAALSSALAAWTASRPVDREMVSGFALAMRREEALALGPFDEGFPFYFEDADLCRRVRRAGRRVVLVPSARMVHLFDRSARTAREQVSRWYERSRQRYFHRHYGEAGLSLYRRANERVARAVAEGRAAPFFEPDDLGRADDPPVLELGRPERYVLELATDPAFLFAGGHVGEGERVAFPRGLWDVLAPTRWYVRVCRLGDLEPLRAVSFVKTAPDVHPPGYESFVRGLREES